VKSETETIKNLKIEMQYKLKRICNT